METAKKKITVKLIHLQGDKYWRFNGKKIDGDYPKYISEGFAGIPNNVDAALVWSGNGKIYFFKGNKIKTLFEFQKKNVF